MTARCSISVFVLASSLAAQTQWGTITGALVDQKDLQGVLNSKQNLLQIGTPLQYFRGDQSLGTFPAIPSSFNDVVAMWTMCNPATAAGFLRTDGSCPTGTGATWGSISGDITQQKDLWNQLNSKQPINSKTKLVPGTAYTFGNSDGGAILSFNAAATVAVTVPPNLPIGWNVLVVQLGSGRVVFGGASVTIHQRQNYTGTAGPFAVASLVSYAQDTFVLSGDLQ